MSLKDIVINNEYRSLIDDIARDFYIPLLSQAILYRRAVGFFSSTILCQISSGVAALVKNRGKIQIVASPRLSDEDIIAIKKGYEFRNQILTNAILREMNIPNNPFEKMRLNMLAHLIADGILDIKIAFTENEMRTGMYHEKMGLITDINGNTVVFSGSMNETYTAISLNYESIDLFCSWKSFEQLEKVKSKEYAFTSIWNNTEPNITIIDFPNLNSEFINRYKCSDVDYGIDNDEIVNSTMNPDNRWIQKPNSIKFYDYQLQAMEAWKANNYRGIFDMATGTGKTLTALGALELLCKAVDSNLGIIIVCPYQHLIEQWLDDIKSFGINPLICYSRYDWKKKYRNTIDDFRYHVINNFCIITTNDTLATDFFQNEVDKLKGHVCLVVDEAHNFGAKRQLDCMKDVFKYRLALSATLERRYDENGTLRLKDFFGEKCIEYSLERAIKENKLTPYYYYPIPIYLDEDELEEYNILTEKIMNILYKSKKAKELPKSVEMLLIRRARIVAAARNKLKALYEIIRKEYQNDNQILVYCGAATIENSSYKEGEVDPYEKRQINIVIDMLGNELGMRVSKFTSEEDSKEREAIKAYFASGDMLQVLVAIRCLDEGVNIPGIKTAFILASSTNPKEYIQRRGRVLRKAPNKLFAKIYDFITLPRDLNAPMYRCEYYHSEYSLIRREYERMEDFARLSENPSDVTRLQDKISDFYKLNYIGGQDYGI